jgi:hypothetical protein
LPVGGERRDALRDVEASVGCETAEDGLARAADFRTREIRVGRKSN